MNTTKHISIALNLPKVVSALLLFGRHVVQAMTNNAWFPNPDPPLNLAAGHFGMGHGSGAHAPDEYFVIESENKNIDGFDGAAMSYVDYFYALAK